MHTRRQFITTTSAAALAAATHSLAAKNSDTIKVAMVGCGGRGTGAASQNLTTDKGLRLIAMADISQDQIDKTIGLLKKKHPEQVDVSTANQFVGFEAYKEAIALAAAGP